ncbi:MAG: transcriptional repressor DicA [Pelotomaculum sp. PtaB.Bin104]|nr:MAG: transcriptional repressor DicA [Pelotomaculum sp. PtaB.Bin104]
MNNKIAELRKGLDMTQDDLAKAVGISRPYLSDIENSKYNPGGPLMLKIAKVLKATVEDVFSDDE